MTKAEMTKIATVKELSTEELQAELNRRVEEGKEAQRLLRAEMIKLVVENKETLLKFITHSRTSCANDDEMLRNSCYHPSHCVAECARCCLIDLCDGQDDIDININLTMTKVRDENKKPPKYTW